MRQLSVIIGMMLIFAGCLGAQQAGHGPIEFTCPLDGHKFSWPAAGQPIGKRGVDSDMCPHQMGVSNLSRTAITCPRCNYTEMWMRFVSPPFEGALRDKLLAALASSGYRGVENSFSEIPVWERCRLGLTCASVRGLKASERADFLLLGIYVVRIRATRSASRSHRFGYPMRNSRLFANVERKMIDEIDPPRRARLKLHLAMLAQRMGLPIVRDRWVSATSKDAGLTKAQRAELKEFRNMVRIEKGFQEKLLLTLEEALAETDIPLIQKMSFNYLKADTLRRLDRLKEAATEFQALRLTMTEPSPRRDLCDYFITLLKQTPTSR